MALLIAPLAILSVFYSDYRVSVDLASAQTTRAVQTGQLVSRTIGKVPRVEINLGGYGVYQDLAKPMICFRYGCGANRRAFRTGANRRLR